MFCIVSLWRKGYMSILLAAIDLVLVTCRCGGDLGADLGPWAL